MLATGKALMVTLAVAVLEQVPFEKLQVTVYVPAVLVTRLIAPVPALMTSPAVEL
jgi:hypothetical protein